MANPILTYDAEILSPGIDLTITGAGTPNITATYTDATTAGGTPPSTDLARCTVAISYADVQWTLNNDNSVTVTGRITSDTLTRTRLYQGTTGIDYMVWTEFNGSRTFSAVVHGESSGTYDLNLPNTFSVTVPPRGRTSAVSIHFYSRWTQPGFAPDEFTLGLIIENPNLPDYRPGKIWNGSAWVSHNRSAGFEKIYTAQATTREMRTMNGGVGTGNPPLIMHQSEFKNQRKIGNE